MARLISAVRTELGMSQEAFGAMTARSAESIRQYEHGLRRPPAIFFHDLIEAAPECGLRFNDIAAAFGYRPIDSVDPAQYPSIHEFFTGVRVLGRRSRIGFAAILSVPAAHIAAVERWAKPEPELVQRLARRFLRPEYTYADVVERFRTLRPSPLDLRLRRTFRQLNDPAVPEQRRGQIRADLIRDNMDIARRLARREARRLAEPGDADEVWTLALVKAVDGHDPRRGDFIPYLRKRIFGEVRQQARREWLSGTADALKDTATRICKIRDALRQDLHREPTATEIAARLEMSVGTVAEALRALAARRTQPLDHDIAAPAAPDKSGAFSAKMCQRLTYLDERLRTVIDLRFLHHLDMAEIAERIEVDAATAAHMLDAALEKLRQHGGP